MKKVLTSIEKLDICNECKHFWKATTQCGICKCFMIIKVHTPLPCPDTPPKWLKGGEKV